MEPYGFTSGLPSNYLLVHFHHFHQIKTATKTIFLKFGQDSSSLANQWHCGEP